MANGRGLIPDRILARAAFELLASSSIERYVRVADQVASNPMFRESLEASGHETTELLAEADSLWRTLTCARQREPHEAALAILLPVLASSAAPEVDQFLSRVAIYDRPPLAWSSAQARELLRQRPSNVTTTVPGTVGTVTSLAAHDVATQAIDYGVDLSIFDSTARPADVSDKTLIAA